MLRSYRVTKVPSNKLRSRIMNNTNEDKHILIIRFLARSSITP